MPQYHYQAKEGPDKLIEGVIEAPTEAAAIEKISQQGVVPVKITLREKVKETVATPRTGVRWHGNSRVFLFSGNLARLIKVGVPVLRSMHLLASQETDPKVRQVLESIERDIREGKTLSRAMELYPQMFAPMYVAVVRAGEVSGGLQQALSQMAQYYKKQEEFSSKVRRAMAYPILLAFAGVASIFFIITFLVPKLQRVFADIGQDLPLPTRLILSFGSFMDHYWLWIVLLLGGSVLFLPRLLRDRFGKGALDPLKLRLPLFGDLIVKIEFSRFSRVLGLCFSNGLSFLESLRVAIPSVDNTVIRRALEDCCARVEKGSSFGQTLRKYPYFSDLTANMISVGEESGKVEETLIEIAEVYERETDDLLIYSTTFLEPLMILFVGGIIGFIVMAVLLPIFEMNTAL